jgi:CarboxypepD_reg-like domain
MILKSVFLFLITVQTMILRYAEIGNYLPILFKGRVIEAGSNRPIKGAHVYIIQGEEEAFTSSNGEFELKTMNKLPVDIIVVHKDFRKEVIRCNSDKEPLIILLSPANIND